MPDNFKKLISETLKREISDVEFLEMKKKYNIAITDRLQKDLNTLK